MGGERGRREKRGETARLRAVQFHRHGTLLAVDGSDLLALLALCEPAKFLVPLLLEICVALGCPQLHEREGAQASARERPLATVPGHHVQIHHTQGPPPLTSSGKPAPFDVLGARENELILAPLLHPHFTRPTPPLRSQTGPAG